MRFYCFLISLLLPLFVRSQPGCTDPQALNFDETATTNDGSCLYGPTSYTPSQVGQLPATLEECSGLAFFNNQLWTHLDGGNPERLYLLDTLNAAQLQTILLPGTDNEDWEDLAEDDTWLYIGDFGNNGGDRTNLTIYKIMKSQLSGGAVTPQQITFSFSDQTNFDYENNSHNFDCEAFFYYNDSLHLFSKNWQDFKTRHYALSADAGSQVAQLRDSFNVQGQITAADVSADGKVLLLGYNVNTSEAFCWLLFDFPGSRFFAGNKRKISLGSALNLSQVEGLAFRDERSGYICSERYSLLPPRLLRFDIGAWTLPVATGHVLAPEQLPLRVSPTLCTDACHVEWPRAWHGDALLRVSDRSGRVVFSKRVNLPGSGYEQMAVGGWPAGVYVATLNVLGSKVWSARFLVQH